VFGEFTVVLLHAGLLSSHAFPSIN